MCHISDPEDVQDDAATTPVPEVSFNTLIGEYSSCTLHFKGVHQGQKVNNLVDSGNTFNFIKPSVAQHLAFPSSLMVPFKVYVGSGDFLSCNTISKAVLVTIQNISFEVDLFHLDIFGVDMVFGMMWLKSLG